MATKQFACAKSKPVIAIGADVKISAGEVDGDKKTQPKFTAEFYTGGALEINGWDLPVVVDLAGLEPGNVLVANLDHDRTQRVGNFAVANDGKSLVANGTALVDAFPAAKQVADAAVLGYQWQASLEVNPTKVEAIKKGQTAEANGRTFEGPLYVTRTGTLKGFGFVTHGADDNTSATIAAIAASPKEQKKMKAEVKAWAMEMIPSLDVDSLDATEIANLERQYAGLNPEPKKKHVKLDDGIEAKQKEVDRVDEITEIALKACDARPYSIDGIKQLANEAIEGKWGVDKFRLELLTAATPQGHTVFQINKPGKGLTDKVLEAAICQAGRLADYEKKFDDQTLQAAHDRFKGRIGLKQLFLLGAEANGCPSNGFEVNVEVQRAAFGMVNQTSMRAAGFSTISIPNVTSNVANKFLHEGWMSVDQTPLSISAIRNVSDFKQITTVTLTGGFQFEKIGPDGNLKSAAPGDMTYTNQADTYGIICAITRKDIINDDLGALTAVPRRIGRGGMLKLNDIFWTAFLNNSAFFTSGNVNVNTAVADITVGGLAATETIFINQTDPDGKPLGIQAAIVLVPTGSKAGMTTLMTSERLITGNTTTQGDGNIWRDRFKVFSSPYMSNSAYTGYDAAAWYMLADPNVMPVIEIAALNGQVEPHVETASAAFDVLGVQMRGYSDVGVTLQEYRGGVRADGGSS